MPPQSASFSSVASVPVHYARPPVAPYGTRGLQRTFWCDPDLLPALEGLVQEIKQLSPEGFGPLEVITSAGAFVAKPGAHGKGKAFDLDGLFWHDVHLVAIEQDIKTILYLAVQSLCNRHFGVVLGFNYNAAHKDHLHIDLGRSVRFRAVKSVTYFLQETVNSIYGENVVVDGEWGNETDGAVTRVRNRMGIGTLSNTANWREFLLRISTDAFSLADAQREQGLLGDAGGGS